MDSYDYNKTRALELALQALLGRSTYEIVNAATEFYKFLGPYREALPETMPAYPAPEVSAEDDIPF